MLKKVLFFLMASLIFESVVIAGDSDCRSSFARNLKVDLSSLKAFEPNGVYVGALVELESAKKLLGVAPQFVGHRGVVEQIKFRYGQHGIENFLWGGEIQLDPSFSRIVVANNTSGMLEELISFGFARGNYLSMLKAFLKKYHPELLSQNGDTEWREFRKKQKAHLDLDYVDRHELLQDVLQFKIVFDHILSNMPLVVPEKFSSPDLNKKRQTLAQVKVYAEKLKFSGVIEPELDQIVTMLSKPVEKLSWQEWIDIRRGFDIIEGYLNYTKNRPPKTYQDKVVLISE